VFDPVFDERELDLLFCRGVAPGFGIQLLQFRPENHAESGDRNTGGFKDAIALCFGK
jgi:hypothetical protein